jgi:SAM-dependent methyltransferase
MFQEKVIGWDFGYLQDRMIESPVPWDYVKIVSSKIKPSINLLDLGTGGGELLSKFANEQINIYATESYEPNFEIARKQLDKFGGRLITEYTDDDLPFPDEYFDLITDSNESYNIIEDYRILKPGGYFITQQVDGRSDLTLNEVLNLEHTNEFLHWNLNFALNEFSSEQFHIIKKAEDFGFTRFKDSESVIFYIKSIPWHFENFNDIDFNEVKIQLDKIFSENKYFDVAKHRFLIVAKKK